MSNLDISFLLGKKVSFEYRQPIKRFPFAPENNIYGPIEELQGIIVGGFLEILNKDGQNTIRLLISCKYGILTNSPGSIKIISEY